MIGCGMGKRALGLPFLCNIITMGNIFIDDGSLAELFGWNSQQSEGEGVYYGNIYELFIAGFCNVP